MTVDLYPWYQAAQQSFAELCGTVGGLFDGMYYEAPQLNGQSLMETVSSDIPGYHRLLFADHRLEVNYHLSGYGLSKHEALRRLCGENVERYAGLMAESLYQDRSRCCSLKQLQAAGCETIPPSYLHCYSEQQRQNLAAASGRSNAPISDDSQFKWSPCNSLYQQDREIWVPNQYLYTSAVTEPLWLGVAVSTGTAAHRSFSAALQGALLEYIQIHLFNLIWYGSQKAQPISGRSPLINRLFKKLRLEEDYQLTHYYCNGDQTQLPPIIATVIRNRHGQEPYLLCGLQGDFDLEKAMLRSALEAHAIVYSGIYNGIEGIYLDTASWPLEQFSNLDANVMHYANAELSDRSDEVFRDLNGEPIEYAELAEKHAASPWQDSEHNCLKKLLLHLEDIDAQGCYQNITPLEIVDHGWQVVRVYFPGLLPVCLPGYPPLEHPAYRRWSKGVVNHAPHPLP